MQVYEIRVLKSGGRAALSSQEIHLSDRGAINAARRLATGKAFEVWRDLDCVHRSPACARKIDAANANFPPL